MTTPSDFDSGGTPGTTPDPLTSAEGDGDQLPQEDTLLDRGVDNILDEGYSPPERPPVPNRLETHLDQQIGESHDDKLAQEEPEVWETTGRPAGATEPDRAGRLAPEEADPMGGPSEATTAADVGIAGGGAGAEEAAVHVTDVDVPELPGDDDLPPPPPDEDFQDLPTDET